jgi:hypothetical protein
MADDRYAFPCAGLDLHQRGCTFREFAAALIMAQLVGAASTADLPEPEYDVDALAADAETAAHALCEVLGHFDGDPDEGEAHAEGG